MKPLGTKVLNTLRLVLRKIASEDAESLFSVGNLRESLQDTNEIIDNMIKYNDDPLSFHWVLEYQGKAVGRIKGWEVDRVYCMVRESNPASIRVCEKVSMTQEGFLRKHWIQSDGTYTNVHIYGLLASDI